jgi:hypothetical protein
MVGITSHLLQGKVRHRDQFSGSKGWTCKKHIGAVQVTFTNGFTISAGKIHRSHAYQSKRFSANERVKSFTLWDNFDGNRLGGIQIVTDKDTFLWVIVGGDHMSQQCWLRTTCGRCGKLSRD